MKVSDLERVLHDTPVTVPVFRITRLPDWAQAFSVGDEVFWNRQADTFTTVKLFDSISFYGHNLALGASHVKFVEYRTMSDLERS